MKKKEKVCFTKEMWLPFVCGTRFQIGGISFAVFEFSDTTYNILSILDQVYLFGYEIWFFIDLN